MILPLLFAVLLAGCAGNPSGGESASVELAVSQQAAGSEARQRAKVHTELGRLYLEEGRHEVALDEARIAMASDSAYAPAYNLMGLVYMALRRNELAAESFRSALGMAGNDPEINNDYGWFLCQTGRARESIAHFRVAIGNPLFQAPVKALVNAGYCATRIPDDRLAEDYLQRALRLEKGNLAALYWLADLAYRSNRSDEARTRLQELHGLIEPTAASAWLALRVDRKLGDREGEARHMGLLRRKHRDSAEYQKLMRGEFD
jgi:type IV pilus assembly protein PilF